jgi:hypothetical protein
VLIVFPSCRVCHLGHHLTESLLRQFSSFIPLCMVYHILGSYISMPRLLYPEFQFLPLVLPPPRPPRPDVLPPPVDVLLGNKKRIESNIHVITFFVASVFSFSNSSTVCRSSLGQVGPVYRLSLLQLSRLFRCRRRAFPSHPQIRVHTSRLHNLRPRLFHCAGPTQSLTLILELEGRLAKRNACVLRATVKTTNSPNFLQ